MSTRFNEDFETVDAGLVPNPFDSVNVGAGNALTAAAVGNPTQGLKIDFGGTSSTCYGRKNFSPTIKNAAGAVVIDFDLRVVDIGSATANSTTGLMTIHAVSGDIIYVRWKNLAGDVTGKINVFMNLDGVGFDSTVILNENTYYHIKLIIKRLSVKVYIDGALQQNITAVAPIPAIDAVYCGTSVSSVVPSAAGEINEDNIVIRHNLNAGGSDGAGLGTSGIMEAASDIVMLL